MIETGTTVLMEGVKLIFLNFSGEVSEYNQQGHRTFSVLLDDEIAKAMEEDGWNVKYLKPREEDEEDAAPQAHLPVRLNFEGRPPKVMLVTSRKRTHLDASTVGMLDWAEISNVDMIIRASVWDVNNKQGIKAYAQSMYVTIVEDALDLKYSDDPVEA